MNYAQLSAQTRPRRTSIPATDPLTAGRKHRPDYVLLVCALFLLIVGTVTIFAIGPGITIAEGLPDNYFSMRQLTAAGLGLVAFGVASQMSIKRWRQFELPLVAGALAVSFAVRLFGQEVYGAYRWLYIGPLSFQAAELAKLALVVWLAGFLSRQKSAQQLESATTYKALATAIGLVVVVVAGLQGDFGSAAVMLAIIGMLTFVIGMPMQKLLLVAVAIVVLASVAILGSDYRRGRIATFLNPAADCQNEGYQVCQALITVGSGGVLGVGLGKSVQAYGYLPEAENDSIFAIVSEKYGFLGASIVVGAFLLLFKRIKDTAQFAQNNYTRLLVTGILIWLSAQMIINVGAMLGLLPLKGITLPLISYGGTSILFVLTAIGIVFQASRFTDLTKSQRDEPDPSKKSDAPRTKGLNPKGPLRREARVFHR